MFGFFKALLVRLAWARNARCVLNQYQQKLVLLAQLFFYTVQTPPSLLHAIVRFHIVYANAFCPLPNTSQSIHGAPLRGEYRRTNSLWLPPRKLLSGAIDPRLTQEKVTFEKGRSTFKVYIDQSITGENRLRT